VNAIKDDYEEEYEEIVSSLLDKYIKGINFEDKDFEKMKEIKDYNDRKLLTTEGYQYKYDLSSR